jgi:hypothetical protein
MQCNSYTYKRVREFHSEAQALQYATATTAFCDVKQEEYMHAYLSIYWLRSACSCCTCCAKLRKAAASACNRPNTVGGVSSAP